MKRLCFLIVVLAFALSATAATVRAQGSRYGQQAPPQRYDFPLRGGTFLQFTVDEGADGYPPYSTLSVLRNSTGISM